MDDQQLDALKGKVDQAVKLKNQIAALEDFIASCNAEVGFLNVTMNYKNQNEIKLVNHFTAKEAFEAFSGDIKDAAERLKGNLETEFKNLK